eukprot:UN15075
MKHHSSDSDPQRTFEERRHTLDIPPKEYPTPGGATRLNR